jgi:oxygen-independent coproporphyrinogen-3 oxidase
LRHIKPQAHRFATIGRMPNKLSTPRAEAPSALSESLLRRFDTPGPRYTSYPTADRFGTGFGEADLLQALRARGQQSGQGSPAPLSVYVHIPFCESVCYYCACNKIITKHHERGDEYLDALDAEISLVGHALGSRQPMSQLHLGGGSPTFLSDAELERLMAMLARCFALTSDAEVSIEVDPRTVTPERLAHLRRIGFNRVSFGVQDFDAQVQQAVHRVQPYENVRDLMVAARELGYESINADLIYGLPRQTPESLVRTIAQIGALRPDRIALYAYAHLPQRFKPQRRIVDAELPSASARVKMLGDAIAGLLGHGYQYIGMDHFALPDDALASAKREGRLHRNFQGYSTQSECDLIGLGVSAIGRVGTTYSQNAKTLPEYCDALLKGRLPVERGLALDADDCLRRDVIMSLMCQGQLDFAAIEREHAIDVRRYFERELTELLPLVDAGLVESQPGRITVTETGWYVVRAVAMVFDRHLRERSGTQTASYSRIV